MESGPKLKQMASMLPGCQDGVAEDQGGKCRLGRFFTRSKHRKWGQVHSDSLISFTNNWFSTYMLVTRSVDLVITLNTLMENKRCCLFAARAYGLQS